jgi:predicted 3-demethylubiquinone-9 3-methyltransferase (glyoxalase superfamily)
MLSNAGVTSMPHDAYGFSRQFVWVQNHYGVSWQLNLS